MKYFSPFFLRLQLGIVCSRFLACSVSPLTTDYYELNTLTDITETQMRDIYTVGIGHYSSVDIQQAYYTTYVRTTIFKNMNQKAWNSRTFCFGSFANCINMEICNLNCDFWATSYVAYMFYYCIKLRKIICEIIMPVNEFNQFYMFADCWLLEEVRLRKNMYNLSFSSSPLISYDSLNFLVTNSANTKAITITVHADTYAKLTDTTGTYPDWVALTTTASGKNIAFASA